MGRLKRKVAVVLSGGGAKGAYEAGALATIVRKTPEIYVVTGASIGAINAAVFAWEYEKTGDLIKAADKVKLIWLEFDNLFNLSFCKIIYQAFYAYLKTKNPLAFSSFISNNKIKAKLNELIPADLRISDLRAVELIINSTSLSEGKTVSFSRTNDALLQQAVLASSALPLIFESQVIANNFYVDGGIFNNTPLRDALKAQASDIFIIELKPKTKELYVEAIRDDADFSNIYQVGNRLVELISDKIMYEDLKNAKRINEIIDVIRMLESSGANSKVIERLKQSIGYSKNGQFKRYVNLYEIAPSKRLDPPGTLGFSQNKAIQEIILLGEVDAEEQLNKTSLVRPRVVS